MLVSSAYLFGQDFRTATNAQTETASYAVRSRLDFEPATLGDSAASGYQFLDPVSGASRSSFSANSGTNPNPRCASASGVVALTSDTNDYREAGLSFRGPDRKFYNAIWSWDR